MKEPRKKKQLVGEEMGVREKDKPIANPLIVLREEFDELGYPF